MSFTLTPSLNDELTRSLIRPIMLGMVALLPLMSLLALAPPAQASAVPDEVLTADPATTDPSTPTSFLIADGTWSLKVDRPSVPGPRLTVIPVFPNASSPVELEDITFRVDDGNMFCFVALSVGDIQAGPDDEENTLTCTGTIVTTNTTNTDNEDGSATVEVTFCVTNGSCEGQWGGVGVALTVEGEACWSLTFSLSPS